jgi:hypothetical protein
MSPRNVIRRPPGAPASTLVQPFSSPQSSIDKRTVLGRSRPRDEGGQAGGLGFHPSGSGTLSPRMSSRLGPVGTTRSRILPLRFTSSSGSAIPPAAGAGTAQHPGPSPLPPTPPASSTRRPGDLRTALSSRHQPAHQPTTTAPVPFFPPPGSDVWIRLPQTSPLVFPTLTTAAPAAVVAPPRLSRQQCRNMLVPYAASG